MKKNESKYFYTATLMNRALLSLLEKKDIEFITITEITAKAGVNRSTFYLHYDNIYELLEETIENYAAAADAYNDIVQNYSSLEIYNFAKSRLIYLKEQGLLN